MAILTKKLLMYIKLVGNNRKQIKCKILNIKNLNIKITNITCPNRNSYGKYWWFSLEVLHYITYLKIDAFKITDNKNNGKLFSKHKLLFLDQDNSSSDTS